MRTKQTLFYFPMVVLMLGVAIHVSGLLRISQSTTLWNIWVDISMLIINISVFYGLWFRKKWGYYMSIMVFVLLGLTQLYLAAAYNTGRGSLPFELQNAVALAVYIIVVICLYLNKYRFFTST